MSLVKEIKKEQEDRVTRGDLPFKEWPLSETEFETFKEELAVSCSSEQQKEMLKLSRRLYITTPYGRVAVFVGLH